MNPQNYRGTSFKNFFSTPKTSSNSGPHTIPREGGSTFYLKPLAFTSSKCLMKGWLKRQSSGIMKSWNSRWFVLMGENLIYYSSNDESKRSLIGKIFLPGHAIKELPHGDQQKFLFELALGADHPAKSRSGSHLLCAESEEERKEWVKNIKEVLYGKKGGAIFGRPLEVTLMYENEKDKDRKVPELVQLCVEYLEANGLETEGLFRLPGRSSLVKQLRNAFDVGEPPAMDPAKLDVHSIASLLKAYLRELPGPLIPINFYDPVMHIITRELDLYPEESVEKLSKVISKLPSANYNLLHYLCCFLHEVGKRADVNRMSNMNLATVFSQSFIQPEDDDPALLMGTSDNRSKAAFILISRVDQIFTGETPDENESQNSPLSSENEHVDSIDGSENGDIVDPFKGVGKVPDDADGYSDGNFGSWLSIDGFEVLDDNHSRVQNFRRSASVDDLFNRGASTVCVSTQTDIFMAPTAAVDGLPEATSLLTSDPSQLTNEELIAQFRLMQEELQRQHQAVANLNSDLSYANVRHMRKLRTMAERLNDERKATSVAVGRIVDIQAKLEQYQLKYGPL